MNDLIARWITCCYFEDTRNPPEHLLLQFRFCFKYFFDCNKILPLTDCHCENFSIACISENRFSSLHCVFTTHSLIKIVIALLLLLQSLQIQICYFFLVYRIVVLSIVCALTIGSLFVHFSGAWRKSKFRKSKPIPQCGERERTCLWYNFLVISWVPT